MMNVLRTKPKTIFNMLLDMVPRTPLTLLPTMMMTKMITSRMFAVASNGRRNRSHQLTVALSTTIIRRRQFSGLLLRCFPTRTRLRPAPAFYDCRQYHLFPLVVNYHRRCSVLRRFLHPDDSGPAVASSSSSTSTAAFNPRVVYDYIDALTMDGGWTSTDQSVENGDLFRPPAGMERWTLLEGATIESMRFVSVYHNDTVQERRKRLWGDNNNRTATPLFIDQLWDVVTALCALESYDQLPDIADKIRVGGLLRPRTTTTTTAVTTTSSWYDAYDDLVDPDDDFSVFANRAAFLTLLVTPELAHRTVRSFSESNNENNSGGSERVWLELEMPPPPRRRRSCAAQKQLSMDEPALERIIVPRRPYATYLAPVIARHDDLGYWRVVVLLEIVMSRDDWDDLLQDCQVESPRLKAAQNRAQRNTNRVEGVVIVDDFISTDRRVSLCAKIDAFAQHQASTTATIDYYPNTNNVVRNLVHPSLYCYVDQVSTLQQPISEAPLPPLWPITLSSAAAEDDLVQTPLVTMMGKDFWGRRYQPGTVYQWLPTYFDVAEDGSCTIADYINNLVPRDHVVVAELYTKLAKLFECCLPYIESVYSYVCAVRPLVRNDEDVLFYDPEMSAPLQLNDVQYCTLRGQKLQVITKIVDYELVRDQTHADGIWHVQGMAHEDIVLTAVYIVDRDDEFHGADIEFKRAFLRPEADYLCSKMPEFRPIAVEQLVEEGLVPLGKVSTPKGRLIVFPNLHVHKVTDISFVPLSDQSKSSAKRRIVAFLLVNPYRRIVSTREILPQQMTCGGTMSLDDALTHRLELMHERRHTKQDWNVHEIELCEH